MLSRLEISQSDFDELTAFIKEKYGLDLARKKSIVESRLSNYVLDCGFNSFSEYLSAVYSDETGRETANLINPPTTNIHISCVKRTFPTLHGEISPLCRKKRPRS